LALDNNWAIALELSLGYLAGEANEPVDGDGLLNGPYSAPGAV